MKNIKELTKIANKLDSLGLTKEADVLDAYIRKAASFNPFGEAPGALGYKPDPEMSGLLKKWLDYMMISNVMVTNSRAGVQKCVDELIKISKFINDQADLDNTSKVGFITWFSNNIEETTFAGSVEGFSGAYNVIADEIIELADDIEERVKEFPGGTWDKNEVSDKMINIAAAYLPVAKSLRFVAEKFRKSYNSSGKETSAPKSTPSSSGLVAETKTPGGASAMTDSKVYPKKSVVPMTWDKYIAKIGPAGSEVKKAWEKLSSVDTSSTRRDSSFPSFKSWYLERKGGEWGGMDKNPEQTIAAINNEIGRVGIWGTETSKPTTTTGAFPKL